MTDEDLRKLKSILEDREKENETHHQKAIDQVNKWAQGETRSRGNRCRLTLRNENSPDNRLPPGFDRYRAARASCLMY